MELLNIIMGHFLQSGVGNGFKWHEANSWQILYVKEIAIVWVSWMIIGIVADADLKLRPETRVLETVIRIRSLSWWVWLTRACYDADPPDKLIAKMIGGSGNATLI